MPTQMHEPNTRKPITLHRLRELYTSGEKLTMLTCYDATFARVLDEGRVSIKLSISFCAV